MKTSAATREHPAPPQDDLRRDVESQTIYQKVVATILVFAALGALATILVPFFLALVLAIALSPLADRLERLGLNRTLASLACLLLAAAVTVATIGLVAYQAGTVLQDADTYMQNFSRLLARLSDAAGGDRILQSMGLVQQAGEGAAGEGTVDWSDVVRRNARALGGWVAQGLGGLLGFVGGLVIVFAFLIYMLLTRSQWVERFQGAALSLGLRPRSRELQAVRGQVATYIKHLAFVSACYVVVTALFLWSIGVPQPILWGVLAGVLELVPYFGPVIAGALPTIVALGAGELWQPLAVVGFFTALQVVEGYAVAPLLYAGSVDIDPVTGLLGVMFFGYLWGPIGLALAMPMLILLRGLILITPDTPALDALADTVGQGADAARRDPEAARP